MSLSGIFKFVLIPADTNEPIQCLTADKSGGLSEDALIRHAKEYFYDYTGARSRAAHLASASAQERQQIVTTIRQQFSSESTNKLDDDTIINMLRSQQLQPTCDIIAVTVPVAGNGYTAVSLYVAENAKDHGFPLNARATALLTACGHNATTGIFGNVFIGRAHDDEARDIWERTDFDESDADPAASWCAVARSRTGGGGSSSAAGASSLSGLLQQQFQQNSKNNLQVLNAGGDGSTTSDGNYGMNGSPPVREPWGSWTQSEQEVELTFTVPSGTKSKYCKVNFSRSSLKITVSGQTLLQGTSFDPIVTDECTFTLQDGAVSGNGGERELCVTLTKAETGRIWPFVTK